jgi:hypothetical protein
VHLQDAFPLAGANCHAPFRPRVEHDELLSYLGAGLQSDPAVEYSFEIGRAMREAIMALPMLRVWPRPAPRITMTWLPSRCWFPSNLRSGPLTTGRACTELDPLRPVSLGSDAGCHPRRVGVMRPEVAASCRDDLLHAMHPRFDWWRPGWVRLPLVRAPRESEDGALRPTESEVVGIWFGAESLTLLRRGPGGPARRDRRRPRARQPPPNRWPQAAQPSDVSLHPGLDPRSPWSRQPAAGQPPG